LAGGPLGGVLAAEAGGVTGGARRLELLKQQERLHKEIEANAQDRMRAEEDLRRARENRARALADRQQSQAAYHGAMADWNESQASVAGGSAVRLALLGPAGRMRAKWAFDMVQKHPHLLAQSPEIAGMAMQYAPDTVRKLLEQQGE